MLGFTRQEQGVILFLVATLLLGCIVMLWQRYFGGSSLPEVPLPVIEEFEARVGQLSHPPSIVKEDTLSGSATSKQKGETSRVNLNEASADELKRLPGIGATLATRIIEYRSTKGTIVNIEELLTIRGIGRSTLERIRPHITLE